MDSKTPNDFLKKILEFRLENIDLHFFQEWANLNSKILSDMKISDGLSLRLRRGDKQTVMKSIASILPPCKQCNALPPSIFFYNRQDQENVFLKINSFLKNGILNNISKPDWYHPDSKPFGADTYYICATCNSMWTLVQPEHEDNGCWQRIA